MIKTFAEADTETLFNNVLVRRFKAIEVQARKRLRILNAAVSLHSLAVLKSNGLHQLTGDREGQHAIRINMQWRICFVWRDGNAYDVEIVDYH